MAFWTEPSGFSLGEYEERNTVSIALPIAQDSNIDVSIISGEIPRGLRLEGKHIVGTPFQVEKTTKFRAVFRATNSVITEDRTFNIVINGPDEPVWVTNEGRLPVANNGLYFILDNEPVDFQLQAIDEDLPAGDELEFFIRAGTLPPGLQLTKDGRIIGVIEPLLALDKNSGAGYYDDATYDNNNTGYDFSVLSSNGYESYFYDSVIYDLSIPTRVPKKLNRVYEFEVSVTDGETEAKRKFKIYVVGDDFLRADNTIVKIANGLYTADNTYLRTPIWVTPSNLGYKRADNYVTIFLDTIDTNNIAGVLTYELLPTNPDTTPSVLPPGTELDSITGEVAGRVPYQPAVTKEYTFTVRARRLYVTEEEAYKDKTFTVKILGEVDSTIIWQSETDIGTISPNFISTFSVVAETTIPEAPLLYRLAGGRLPPGLALSYDGEIIGKVRQFGTADAQGITVFDSNNLVFDGNTTTIDREFTFTVEARDRFGYSASTKEFTIKVTDPEDILYSNIYMQPFLKVEQKNLYRNFTSNSNVFPPNLVYRPNDPQFGLQKQIKILLYAGIQTKTVENYVATAAKNHKKKRYNIGELKTAVAKNPGSNDIVYEVVYLELNDPADSTLATRKKFNITQGKTITSDITYTPNNTDPFYRRPQTNTIKTDTDAVKVSDSGDIVRYVSTISNMRDAIADIGLSERDFLPLWMKTAQQDSIQELGYVFAIPLVYCKPGTAEQIKLNIENSDFDFKQLDIVLDRYLIDSTEGNSNEQYILFANYQFNV